MAGTSVKAFLDLKYFLITGHNLHNLCSRIGYFKPREIEPSRKKANDHPNLIPNNLEEVQIQLII